MTKFFSIDSLYNDLISSLDGLDYDKQQLKNALDLAYRYHEGQFRENKGGDQIPYITHPVGVAKIAAKLWKYTSLDDNLDTILAACLTHDLLEDTALESSELAKITSSRVAELINSLTKPSVSQYQDRQERNRIFIELIKTAGSSAKFIKICDASHNLSRPQSMPITLLKKTIRKAKRDYYPLTLDSKFDSSIRISFDESIKKCELVQIDNTQQINYSETLEQYLSYCVNRLSSKVLESHDILDILLELPGITLCFEGTKKEFFDSFIDPYLQKKDTKTLFEINNALLNKNELLLRNKLIYLDKIKSLPFEKIIALPFESLSKELNKRHYFFLGHNSKKAPKWASVASLRAAVSILAEKHRDKEAREISTYSDWISQAEIILDPRVAIDLNLNYEQITKISKLHNAAVIKQPAISFAIKTILKKSELDKDILINEERIKNPASTAIKLIKRAKGDWNKIDDLLGIRLVFLNSISKQKFIDNFVNNIQKSKSSIWEKNIGILENTFICKEIETSSGYKATHIFFNISYELENIESIPCEIQVRTIFEDAWARLAHIVDYKNPGNISNSQRRNLKNLSEICKNADNLSNLLSK